MICFFVFLFLPEKADFVFGYDPILPLFLLELYSSHPPSKLKVYFAKCFLRTTRSNKPKQPICVCGPITVGLRLAKIRCHKNKNGIMKMFFHEGEYILR